MGFCSCAFHACIKILLIIFTIVFGLFAASILGVGIYVLTNEEAQAYFDIIDTAVDTELATIVAVVCISIGGILLLICLAGCCGACFNNKCLLTTYCILMSLVVLLHIAAGVLALVLMGKLGDELEDGLLTFLQEDYEGSTSTEPESEAWNIVQVHLECCGVNGKTDYQELVLDSYEPEPGWIWPRQCCVLNNKDSWVDPDIKDEGQCQDGDIDYIHDKGCYTKLKDWFEQYGVAVAVSMFIFAFVQCCTIILACCVMKKSNEDKSYA